MNRLASIGARANSLLRSRVHVFGYPLSGLDRALGTLMVVSLLTSCAAIQRIATDSLNTGSGDEASVVYVVDGDSPGVRFDPGPRVAEDVILDIQADTITDLDDARCTLYRYGARCDLGTVAEPVLIPVSGTRVSATATYRRTGSNRPYHEIGYSAP